MHIELKEEENTWVLKNGSEPSQFPGSSLYILFHNVSKHSDEYTMQVLVTYQLLCVHIYVQQWFLAVYVLLDFCADIAWRDDFVLNLASTWVYQWYDTKSVSSWSGHILAVFQKTSKRGQVREFDVI